MRRKNLVCENTNSFATHMFVVMYISAMRMQFDVVLVAERIEVL